MRPVLAWRHTGLCLATLAWSFSSVVHAAAPASTPPRAIEVHTGEALQKVLRQPLAPGTLVRIAPGRYRGHYGLFQQAGTAAAPIVITAVEPQAPPVFADSDSVGLAIVDCAYVTVRHLRFENARDMGIQVTMATVGPLVGFDALSSCHHIVIEDVTILGTGAGDWGNHDGIKISGVDHFAVRKAAIRAWGSGGGSGIDVLGSQHGLIEDCVLSYTDRDPGGTDVGIDFKGGSRDIILRTSVFQTAGKEAIEIGQDTGLRYFRSRPGTVLADGTVMDYEAKDIEVAGNVIVGNTFPFMYMKSRDSYVHHNTIIMNQQDRGSRSIVKLTSAANAGLNRACNARFERNLIVYYWNALMTWYQPFATIYQQDHHPAYATFTFHNNAWYQLDVTSQGRHLPNGVGMLGLPTTESNPVYQVDPELEGLNVATGEVLPEQLRIRSADPRLKDIGAERRSAAADRASDRPRVPAGSPQP